jgi:exodeoxyribonuclease V alpha subunit
MTAVQMLERLAAWVERGWLRPLDHAFAGFLHREVRDADALLLLAAALVSHQLGRGHVCLDLADTLADATLTLSLPPADDDVAAGARPAPPGELLAGVSVARWQAALADPRVVGDGAGATPLVLAGTRLYLRRYWQYEREVRAAIEARVAVTAALQARLPAAALRSALDVLFAPAAPAGALAAADWQKIACALAARSAFAVITGGPGTGKTTTVVRLLALLQSLALAGELGTARALRIRLAAPTGKAAARLNESIAGALARLPCAALPGGERVRDAIPRTVTTLHRLLGKRPDTRRFRHDARNPLALDVLVIDEASMVDLEMMAAVLAALPAHARVVLLGDKDQLASVEAGALLGELCRRADAGHYRPDTVAWLEAVSGECIDAAFIDAGGTPLDQSVAMLRVSRRFDAASGIGRLADAVNAGDVAAVQAVLRGGARDLAQLRLGDGQSAAFDALVLEGVAATPARAPAGVAGDRRDGDGTGDDETGTGVAAGHALPSGYRGYLQRMRALQPEATAPLAAFDEWARAVLDAHAGFQVLCALRRGPFGVEGLNARIAAALQAAGLIGACQGWYLGRPVLMTRNDYGLGLMNGDIGITLALPHGGGGGAPQWRLRVAFAAGDGRKGIRWVLPSRLQAVETVFAMTVHKAQGSEFDHVALVLPDAASAILTRELVYTGITRARSRLTLVSGGAPSVLDEAVTRRVRRASGLLHD